MGRIDEVTALFKEGFNCSQALLAVFGSSLGLDRDTALKVASGFGGGIRRMGETCGAVTGACMIIGLRYGATRAGDKVAKVKTYEIVKSFADGFKARNQSVKCRDLLGFDISTRSDAGTIIAKQCPKYIQDAAELIDKII